MNVQSFDPEAFRQECTAMLDDPVKASDVYAFILLNTIAENTAAGWSLKNVMNGDTAFTYIAHRKGRDDALAAAGKAPFPSKAELIAQMNLRNADGSPNNVFVKTNLALPIIKVALTLDDAGIDALSTLLGMKLFTVYQDNGTPHISNNLFRRFYLLSCARQIMHSFLVGIANQGGVAPADQEKWLAPVAAFWGFLSRLGYPVNTPLSGLQVVNELAQWKQRIVSGQAKPYVNELWFRCMLLFYSDNELIAMSGIPNTSWQGRIGPIPEPGKEITIIDFVCKALASR